jgi:hypothetical protein
VTLRFEPSPNAEIKVAHIGQENAPVIVIDGLLKNPDELVQYAALHGDFGAVSDNLYPGVRAPMPLDYVDGAVRALDPLIREAFRLESVKLAKAECFYSIVTTNPDALHPLQMVPHIDTTDPLHFAVVHFLCGPEFGGTGFYRQNATGFESITPDRELEWAEARDRSLADAAEQRGYVSSVSPDYHQTTLFAAQYDRLILYRSNQLHSGYIPEDMLFSADPLKGRLTANFFIAYRTA